MKKYKLIKTYPGSLELGTVIKQREGTNMYFIYGKQCYPDLFPEFWEEIVEYPIGTKVKNRHNNAVYEKFENNKWGYKIPGHTQIVDVNESEIGKYERFQVIEEPKKDYEILSFYTKNISEKNDSYISPYTIEELLNNPNYGIYSVKRLSDRKVLTVGDITCEGKIIGFRISNNKIGVETTHVGLFDLNLIQKVKPILFTTEDGVDIREGDEYFELITPEFHNKPCIWNILPYKTRGNINYDQEGNRKHGRIWFSTKEAAEEYIIMNKPCLSFKEVEKFCSDYNAGNLKQLVKSKL